MNQAAPIHDGNFDVGRFFDKRLEAAEEWSRRNPQPRAVERSIETDKPVAVVFTSDWHIGSPGTSHRQLREDMLTIANHERLYTYIGGDWSNNFVIPALMRAGLGEVFAAGDQQCQIILYITQPLFDTESVIGVSTGNHDNWTKAVSMIDPLYANFGHVPHLCTRDGAVLSLRVGRQTYKIFRRHRPRWYSVFNPAHCVFAEYQRNPWDFDIGVIEHQHLSHYALFDGKERADGNTTRIAVRPGTYKVEDSYADEHGYYYASSEQVAVILWPDKFQMQPVKGLGQTIELLDGLQ